MFKVCKLNNKGSATVETTFVMVIVITVILLIMYVSFFLHDYTVSAAQIKYNMMKNNKEFNSVLFMGELQNKNFRENYNENIYRMKLRYYIPLLGTKLWDINVCDYKINIDKVRRIKVYKDGIEQFR